MTNNDPYVRKLRERVYLWVGRTDQIDLLCRYMEARGAAAIDCENPSTTCYCRVCTLNWKAGDEEQEPPPCHGTRLCDSCTARLTLAAIKQEVDAL